MDKKYFTPEISDIRVGYECEILPINESYGWKKGILHYNTGYKAKDSKSIFNLNPFWWSWREQGGNKYPIMIQVNSLAHIRVPYLTREQIRDEGYSLTEMNRGKYIKYFGGDLHVYDHNGDTFYLGECKCINTFRYITKLLGI